MSGVRVGVIGAGPMGRLHARAIARRAEREGDCTLSYVIDHDPGRSAWASFSPTASGRLMLPQSRSRLRRILMWRSS
jgi:predicted dehydrogenase